MSIASYRRKAKTGLVGPWFDDCMTACCEQVCRDGELLLADYKAYRKFGSYWNSLSRVDRILRSEELEQMITRLTKRLGGITCGDLIFPEVYSKRQFNREIGDYILDGYRVVADIGLESKEAEHSVGILRTRTQGEYRLASTWLPTELKGPLTLGVVYEWLGEPESTRMPAGIKAPHYDFNYSSVTIIPPRAAA
jgi:hypothetical protein